MENSQDIKNKPKYQASKMGWTRQETMQLFSEASKAINQGKTLKTVFERFAQQTGRKPNSIRNYYYNSLKGDDAHMRTSAFVQFTEQEVWNLMVHILSEQARGVSVRSCAMKLGNDQRKDMLRYQNKYRSVIKNNPEYVKKIMEHMQSNNIPCFDPYAEDAIDGRRGNSGRKPNAQKRQSDMIEIIGGIIDDLRKISDVDMNSFLKGLRNLTTIAAGKVQAEGHDTSIRLLETQEQAETLKNRVRDYEQAIKDNSAQLSSQSNRLAHQNEAIDSLLDMLRQLIKINRDFLGQNPVIKVSNLSSYINELARSIENCEKSIKDFAG